MRSQFLILETTSMKRRTLMDENYLNELKRNIQRAIGIDIIGNLWGDG